MASIFTYIVVLLFGLTVGSFSNVVLARLDRKKGIIAGRSECPHCHHLLQWYDLMPVISFVMLQGRCRYCQKPISFWYPAVELVVAISFVLFFWRYGALMDSKFWFELFLMYGFLLLGLFDLKYYILPDKLTLPLAGITLASLLFLRPAPLSFLLSGFLLAGFFAILFIVSKGRWMGLGDAKLALSIGFAFGHPAGLVIIMLSVWTATLVGFGLMYAGKATMKTALPFGTFLCVVCALYILFPHEFAPLLGLFRF